MPIDIIDNFQLGSDIPLDVRYRANTYWDVSTYWYEGMQVYQYSDKQIWYFDGSVWSTFNSVSPFFDILDGGKNWTNPTGNKVIAGTY